VKISPTDRPNKETLKLSQTETLALRAALGEVCGGFYIPDFDVRMGGTKKQAEQLFDKMDQLSGNQQNEIVLTMDEIRLLKKAHEATLQELGAEEYETRTGINFAFGQNLLNEFAEGLGRGRC
jgi:hypothetical protein